MAADPQKEKLRALEMAISQIEKQFGRGSIIRLGDEAARIPVDVVPTGSLGLDIALGIGGVPRGRIIEIYGPESSGKTTLALSILAQAQRLGGTAVFIDAEHAMSPSYARLLGVKIEDLHVSQPDTGEEALEIADQLVRSGAVDIIVIDSVAALVPKNEIEGEMGDSHVGLQARLMSQALRKLTGSVSKSRTCIIFINQIRMQIGVMFGNPETTTGGKALKFYATIRMDTRRVASIKDHEEVVGSRIRVKVVKNKLAPPFRAAEFDLLFKEGLSRSGEILDMAVDRNLISKSGTWFSFGDERLGQGRENARQFLIEHPDVLDRLEREIRRSAGFDGGSEKAPADGGPAGAVGSKSGAAKPDAAAADAAKPEAARVDAARKAEKAGDSAKAAGKRSGGASGAETAARTS
jgi:recombination protein RecA